ncbi:MAG: lipid A biosynthesis acyltransferase [Chitinophagaceae bacterium]|nr:lipid A biosynthesis acyltransferase [Bacteroidota bacterium]MCC6258599.1 lipid A biosynthesis acyltransferase [Chitinophagaceae bacterium]MCW5917938.1 lipid A biosynthesis acyltransferase [Ferruginibacter sp.]
MYRILYAILYLFSLLPFFILYGIGEFFFFIIYRVFRYRIKIVMANLERAFPEKNRKERAKIAKHFYRNLIQTFLETFKMLSISEKGFDKRAVFELEEVNKKIGEGKNIVFLSGHQMNWEWGPWALARGIKIPLVGMYSRIMNNSVDRLFYKMRSRTGVILVDITKFSTAIIRISKQQHAVGLIADQSPAGGKAVHWMNFFGEPTPFYVGPEKRAVQAKAAVFFVEFVKLRWGHYKFVPHLITEDASQNEKFHVMLAYRDMLEEAIQRQPSNYLWSHRRWKRKYDSSWKDSWMDRVPAPDESSFR